MRGPTGPGKQPWVCVCARTLGRTFFGLVSGVLKVLSQQLVHAGVFLFAECV